MRIIQLTAENVKKLRVVDITPKTDVVQITGKNGQGKTSVLDSIWWALGGKDGIQSVPLRKGAEKGHIRLDLGKFVVERKFSSSGATALTVKNADGAMYGSPQTMLDDLIGSLSFDPLAFARMEPRDQFDELRRISKLEIDLDALDRSNATDYTARTDVNRDAKAKRAQAEGIHIPADLPAQPIDESGILNKIQEAAEHNTGIETSKARRELAARDITDKRNEAERLASKAVAHREAEKRRVEDLRKQIADIERNAETHARELDVHSNATKESADALEKKLAAAAPLPEPISVTELRASLDAAKVTNRNVQYRDQKKVLAVEAERLETKAKELTNQIQAREKAKVDAIGSAKMPVEGLGFGDGIITYGGLPFEQASDAEKLRVSAAIAMAGNPKLHVIRIRDGSLLDEDGMKLLAELAAEKDFQVWIERVDSTGSIGVVMEDGAVKEAVPA
jgi:hypothetical protein